MKRPRLSLGRLLAVAPIAALMAVAIPAAAQVNCNYNGTNGNCTTTSSNTIAIRLTVTAATRLDISSNPLVLPAATGAQFDAGVGTSTTLGLVMKSNRSWSLTFRATSATWTGTGPLARLNRPVGDLEWSTSGAGPWTAMTTVNTSLFSGAPATAGTNLTLHFRGRLAWDLDTPGVYTLPLQINITAP